MKLLLRCMMYRNQNFQGATIIDEPFNEVLDLFMRDFVDEWYKDISKVLICCYHLMLKFI